MKLLLSVLLAASTQLHGAITLLVPSNTNGTGTTHKYTLTGASSLLGVDAMGAASLVPQASLATLAGNNSWSGSNTFDDIVFTSGSSWAFEGDTAPFRSALGVAIGTNVQAYDADLTTWAGISPSANVQTLLGSANFAAARTSLGVSIGSDVQAYDADLDDLSDGSLTGSKVGSGISGTNVTSGTVADARIDATLTGKSVNGVTLSGSAVTMTVPATGTAALLGANNTFTGFNTFSAGTNNYSGTASIPAMRFSGVPYAGTGTTSFPLVYIADASATASTTLSTAGTYFGINGDGSQDLANFLKDGISQFKVSSAGDLTAASNITSAGGVISGNINTSGYIITSYSNGYFARATTARYNLGTSDTSNISEYASGVIQFGTTAKNDSGSWRATNGTLLGNLTASGYQEFAQVASGGTVSSNSARIYSKDVSGTAEMFVKDEAGNETQISPHPADAPPSLYDEEPGIESFSASNNAYLGTFRWINHDRVAKLAGMTDAEKSALPPERRATVVVESYADYNKRTGADLKVQDWAAVQAEHEAKRIGEQVAYTARESEAQALRTDYQRRKAEHALKRLADPKLPEFAEAEPAAFTEVRPVDFVAKAEPAFITAAKKKDGGRGTAKPVKPGR